MQFIKLLALSAVFSLLFGQLVRISPTGTDGAINITDILIVINIVVFYLYSTLIRKSLKINKSLTIAISLFALSALASSVISINSYTTREIINGSVFLFRFLFYFAFSYQIYNLINKKNIISWINAFIFIGAVFAAIGLLQLILFPDLTFLSQYGWDPHQRRIVSTILDPNYSGMVFTILFAFTMSMFLFNKKVVYIILSFFFALAVVLTFSRSSYLAFLTVLLIIGLFKSPKTLALALIVFSIVVVTIPNVKTRIIGAFSLDDTAQARLESWQKALIVFSNHPILGVGYNNYRYAQISEGFISQENIGGHAGAGTDSSLLLIMATTGIIGISFFMFLIIRILSIFSTNLKTSYLKLASFSSFLGLLVHTQFVNSFFFPQIMLILFFILGLNLSNDS